MAKGLRAEWQVGEKTHQCLHLHFHLIFFWPEALCTESIFLTPFPIYYQETAGRKGKYWLECSLCLLTDYALHKNGDEIAVCFPFSSVFILSKRVMMVAWCGWGVTVDTHLFPPHNASDPVLSSNTVPSFQGRSLKLRSKVKYLGFFFLSQMVSPTRLYGSPVPTGSCVPIYFSHCWCQLSQSKSTWIHFKRIKSVII